VDLIIFILHCAGLGSILGDINCYFIVFCSFLVPFSFYFAGFMQFLFCWFYAVFILLISYLGLIFVEFA
jgi:hypothetical protein